MESDKQSRPLAHYLSKGSIERATLWVLAIGVFVAVLLNIAKFAVRDYRELLREIDHHQVSGSAASTEYTRRVDYLEGGQTLDEFLEDFPTVKREAAISALEHAKELAVSEL